MSGDVIEAGSPAEAPGTIHHAIPLAEVAPRSPSRIEEPEQLICKSHFERAGVRVPAERVIAGTPLCSSCIRGKRLKDRSGPADPPSDDEVLPRVFNKFCTIRTESGWRICLRKRLLSGGQEPCLEPLEEIRREIRSVVRAQWEKTESRLSKLVAAAICIFRARRAKLIPADDFAAAVSSFVGGENVQAELRYLLGIVPQASGAYSRHPFARFEWNVIAEGSQLSTKEAAGGRAEAAEPRSPSARGRVASRKRRRVRNADLSRVPVPLGRVRQVRSRK